MQDIDRDATHGTRLRVVSMLVCLLLIGLVLVSGDNARTATPARHSMQPVQKKTFSGSTEPITYSTSAHDVLIRTFYGGGLTGALTLSPQISIYGDGSYILGQNRQGKLTADEQQRLLDTLVDTYGILNLKRQQFSDIPDQNMTILQVALNNQHVELVYGAFGDQPESTQDKDEYERLGKALTAITEALQGPTHQYSSGDQVLLARQIFNPDYNKPIFYWPLSEFTLSQVAIYECGDIPPNENGDNPETGCLKYLIPRAAVLLHAAQLQTLKVDLKDQQQGVFVEGGLYYEITLRPLLPDELPTKTLAMFGSAQSSYVGVPLHDGAIPQPTPTPGG